MYGMCRFPTLEPIWLQLGNSQLLLKKMTTLNSSSQGADHYGRYDLPAFHLLVSALSLEQLRERSRFHVDDADLLPSPQVGKRLGIG